MMTQILGTLFNSPNHIHRGWSHKRQWENNINSTVTSGNIYCYNPSSYTGPAQIYARVLLDLDGNRSNFSDIVGWY